MLHPGTDFAVGGVVGFLARQQFASGADGTRAYVTNLDSDTVSVIDTTTNTVTATIPVDSGPVGVAIATS
ncbi:hypothetical protein [Streptomyces sp. NPDC002788]